MTRPLVLLANDDGVGAEGLSLLRRELASWADVFVCAPDTNQSATSHSLTLHRPLRLQSIGDRTFSLDGTPADCVYVALCAPKRVLPRRPDLVVSGLNHGVNLGVDVFYSGTVAAAREAALRGIPGVAVSASNDADRTHAAAACSALARAAFESVRSDRAFLLNVNVPPLPKGRAGWEVRATRLGARLYSEDVIFRKNPRGEEYLWIGGAPLRHDHVAGSDTDAHDHGMISVTALSLDLSDAATVALPSSAGERR